MQVMLSIRNIPTSMKSCSKKKGGGEYKVHKEKRGLKIGLTLGILAALLLACTPPAFALPTATNFGVDNTNGYRNTNVVVPVNITNVQNGPIISLIFDIAYNTSRINVVDVRRGDLTSYWDAPAFNNFAWGTRVAIVYDGNTAHGLQNGTTGSVILLNFSIIGNSGDTSNMGLSNIQLADTSYNVGTAPAKNGSFTIVAHGLLTGHVADIIGTNLDGVTVNLTMMSTSARRTTTTNGTGYYSFNTVEIGAYNLNFTKPRYWENTTMSTVESGATKTVNIILWKKGDLNKNGFSVDAGDLAMMKDASVGKITADAKYDLNTNGLFVDAGDLAMMKDASVGKIELL